jgi:AbrB family looped-hinge helix DNA binding protein
MPTSTVRAGGRVVIPAPIRAELGLRAGNRIEFVNTREGWLIKPATLPVTVLKGVLRKPRGPVSVDRMNLAVRGKATKRKTRDH